MLGPPLTVSPTSIGYDLGLRPNHRWWVELRDGSVVQSEYRHKDPELVAEAIGGRSARRAIADELLRLGADRHLTREGLGAPDEEFGWGPNETWAYADGVHVELRLGVVEGVTLGNGRLFG